MRKAGILGPGEPLPAGEGDDALFAAHGMIDAWSIEELMIPVVSVVTHTLQKGEAEYTIGIYPAPVPDPLPLTHIETARPTQIVSAAIRDEAGTDYPVDFISSESYNLISVKSTEARPHRAYIRNSWPLNTFLFSTVPYANETLRMDVKQPLNEVLPTLALTEDINMPPGYKQALIYNLAIILSEEWGQSPTQTMVSLAASNKKRIKRANYQPVTLRVDAAIRNRRRNVGTYIIESGPGL